MYIEKKLYTQKAKLQRELWKILHDGQKLTFYPGVNGLVNEAHNDVFLTELNSLQQYNYIKDLNETQYVRLNKYLDKMTVKQLSERIAYFKSIVDVYKQMPDETRKALAIAWKLNNLNKLIAHWENKAAHELNTDIKYELLNLVKKAKQDIKKLNILLVA